MEAKAKGAIPIICSPVPRSHLERAGLFAVNIPMGPAVAERNGAFFIDLQERIALRYEALDSTRVKRFFRVDQPYQPGRR